MLLPEVSKIDKIRIGFILGIGRSGTTLLTNILNSNSHIVSSPENNFILFASKFFKPEQKLNSNDYNLLRTLNNLNHNHETSIWGFTKESIIEIEQYYTSGINFRQFCKLLYLNYDRDKNFSEINLIIDKNPVYTLFYDSLIKIFPDAIFIGISRNPIDNIASRIKHKKKKKINPYLLSLSWVHYNRILNKLHFEKKNKIILIRYEDLTNQPELKAKEICNFIEVPFQEKMLSQENNTAKIFNQAKKLLSESGMNKIEAMHGKLHEKINPALGQVNRNDLTPHQKNIINSVCYYEAKKSQYDIPENTGNQTLISIISVFNQLYYVISVQLFLYIYYRSPLFIRKLILNRP